MNNLYKIITEEMPEKAFDIKHSLVTENTKLVYLADVIALPKPYPIVSIISIGDLFLSIGIYLFFQESMVRKKLEKYIIDDDGITVEKTDSTKQYDDVYNTNNWLAEFKYPIEALGFAGLRCVIRYQE